jgi:hypothetical protein
MSELSPQIPIKQKLKGATKMGKYQDDMSNEKRPPVLLPEGDRRMVVTEMIKGTSKKGFEKYITVVEDVKTKKSLELHLSNKEGVRWVLKSLLSACGVEKNAEGKYDWSETDVIGKTVIGMVETIQEEWINREGETVKTPKSKITEFLEDSVPEPEKPQDVAWEE